MTDVEPGRSDVEKLRAGVEQLEHAYDMTVTRLLRDRDAGYVDFGHPVEATDRNGRSLLLDALAAMVTGQAALVYAGRATRS